MLSGFYGIFSLCLNHTIKMKGQASQWEKFHKLECIPVGCVSPVHWCIPWISSSGGSALLGGLPSWGVCLPGGSAFLGSLPKYVLRGVCLDMYWGGLPKYADLPVVDRMTDACKNITFARFATAVTIFNLQLKLSLQLMSYFISYFKIILLEGILNHWPLNQTTGSDWCSHL